MASCGRIFLVGLIGAQLVHHPSSQIMQCWRHHPQNNYYINKVRSIRQNMPAQIKDPLARKRMQGRAAPFSLAPVSPEQVEKIICSLKNSKASGVDLVYIYILKLIKSEIVPSVCHIVNLSILSCKFPTKWKIAKVIPHYNGKG